MNFDIIDLFICFLYLEQEFAYQIRERKAMVLLTTNNKKEYKIIDNGYNI